MAVTAANISVDDSVGAFDLYRQSNPVDAATVAKVRSLALQYKAANVAADAAVQAWKALSNPDTKAAADSAQATLSNVAASLIDLLRTINPSLIKTK